MARRSRHIRTSEEKDGKMTEAKCDICCSSSFQESLLSCHSCITVQHSFCLDTPLVACPDPRWICPACTITGTRPSRKRRPTVTRHEAPNGRMEVGKSEVMNSTTSVTSIAVNQASSSSNARSSGRRRSRISPQAAASTGSAHNISVKTLPNGAAETSSQLLGAQTATALSEGISEGEGASEDPGSTITIFCRRDFRRYLRWKRQKLASQDDEKRREEKNRARKTFSSIIANALC